MSPFIITFPSLFAAVVVVVVDVATSSWCFEKIFSLKDYQATTSNFVMLSVLFTFHIVR